MNPSDAYEDAVDLLDADHKAVKKLFIEYAAMCDDGAPQEAKRKIADKICREILVHAQIEEEIFYPAVGKGTGDAALIDEAIHEHAQAKKVIADIGKLQPSAEQYDDTVKSLGKLIDAHVLEEREKIFLEARQSQTDLRSLVVPLLERKQQLQSSASHTLHSKKVKA